MNWQLYEISDFSPSMQVDVLQYLGFTDEQVAQLAALKEHYSSLDLMQHHLTAEEYNRVLFMRWLVDHGKLCREQD